MKSFIIIGCLLSLQYVWSSPIPEPSCDEVFSSDVCEQYDSLNKKHEQEGLQFGMENELLEKVLLKKLQFLMNIRLFKRVPLIGQFVHDMVERDPEGVSKALAGGIFGVLKLATQLAPLLLG